MIKNVVIISIIYLTCLFSFIYIKEQDKFQEFIKPLLGYFSFIVSILIIFFLEKMFKTKNEKKY